MKKTRDNLYVPQQEKDNCGIGCVVNIDGSPSYSIINDAINMLETT